MLCRRLVCLELVLALVLGPALPLAAQSHADTIESARRGYWEGRFEASLGELERIVPSLSSATERRDAHFLIGLNRLALGMSSEAREAFREAVEADPAFLPQEELYSPDVTGTYGSVREEVLADLPPPAKQPPPEVSAASSRPELPTERFDKIRIVTTTGEKTEESDALLSLEEREIVVRSRKEEAVLKKLAYEDIRAAVYSYSKHPRWKEGIGVAVAVGIFAAPLFFMKGKKHWLSLQTGDDFALLRLDKNNYRLVILAFETRTGIEVEVETKD